jgi:hypothetical protein
MKLGEMLVRDGRITEAQLQSALKRQSTDGGRIGTVLIEQGLVDFETLTVYLGLELGISIATGAALDRAKLAAVRLLQPAQAYALRCVPLVVQDRQLIAAVADPHDFANLEAITQLIGYRVLPRVAPEARIFYYIERYYGVSRPPRFASFGDTPRADDATPTGLPAGPLPGLPPVNNAPRVAPGPRPHLRHSREEAIPRPSSFDDSQALELDAEDLLDTLDADTAAVATTAPPAPSQRPKSSTLPPPIAALDTKDAIAALANADDRNQIAGILLRFASKIFEASVLFTVRDNFGFGWKASGAVPGHANVEHLLIPLDAPSVFQLAINSNDGVFSGAVAPSTLHSYLYRVMGVSEANSATVGVIAIGKRHVNLVYGHRGTALTDNERNEVRDVCRAAAQAYARMIAQSKKKK